MSGLFARKKTADADAPTPGGEDPTVQAPTVEGAMGAETETEAERAGADEGRRRWRRRREQAAEPQPASAPAAEAVTGTGLDIPAGTDLDKLVGPVPTTRRRGKQRRRLRHLRSVREVLLRDLGGMAFEAHRAGRSTDAAVQAVVDEKLARLSTVDSELKDLEAVLDDRKGLVVREPGISGTCPNCGELFGSEARFCWACGTPVAPGARRPPEAIGLTHIESTAVQLPPPPAAPPPPPPAP